ncbi:hypothetical protein HGG71_05755 [Rhodobacteraceae bacterium R_SAG2]|nr:hypothetical protein [Rhodobacteraceae bacterium R_SAG2]
MNDMSLPSVQSARLPKTYEAARQALSECQGIDECQAWADKAAALASYAKQAEDETLLKMATRIKARAVRRAGELLKQIEPGQGARDGKRGEGDHTPSRSDAARAAGMSKHQQVQSTRVANVPKDDFEAQVESDKPPTLSQLAQQGVKPRPVVDLQGRDPKEFNRAMHFVGDFEQYARDLSKKNILPDCAILNPSERQRLRAAINQIDAIHDQIMTRI